MRSVGRLHVLTGTDPRGRHSHAELTRMAIAGGADVIQYRERGVTARSLITTGRDLVELCRQRSVRLIVNDRVDIAIASDAGGVHLGQEDFPISLARELLGPDRLIGASARTPEEAIEAMWSGADYVGAGPVYATDSKADAGAPIGPDGLAAIVRAIEIPVVAIGGIDVARVTEVMEAGAHGIAVIRAVALDADPERATRALREVIDAWLEARRGRGAGAPRAPERER